MINQTNSVIIRNNREDFYLKICLKVNREQAQNQRKLELYFVVMFKSILVDELF